MSKKKASIPKKERPRWALARAYAFAKSKGWWPTCPELCAFIGLPASEEDTVRRILNGLRMAELVGLVNRAWRVTGWGFDYLRYPPITTPHTRRPPPKTRKQRSAEAQQQLERRRLDAFQAFDQAKPVRIMWGQPTSNPMYDRDLEIFE